MNGITIRTYESSDGNHRAAIDDADGNTLAQLPPGGDDIYGYDSAEQAQKAGERWVADRERRGQDIAGGGIK